MTASAKDDAKRAATTKSWYLIHDNINMAFRKYDQRIENQDSFESGTAATLIIQDKFDDLGYRPVIDIILTGVMDLQQDWFKGRWILLGGDQLTVARIRSAIALRWDDVSAYYRLEWAIPVMQLFHLQMLLASTVLRTHYGTQGTPGSLAAIAGMLNKKRVGVDKPDFHATDELLRHTFDAFALRIWQVELESDDLENFSFDPESNEFEVQLEETCDRILDRYFTTHNETDLNGTSSRNAASFLRVAVLYIELTSAAKAGDTGRIKECIKWLTVIFQAGSTKNYANELLRLHCGLAYTWTENTANAVTSSWLVNTTGQPNRWIPADLHQEHNNLLIKTIHSAKGSNSSWDFLEQSVSTNIKTFSTIKSTVEKEFKVPRSGTNHTSANSAPDIAKIIAMLKDNGILDNRPQPDIPRLEGMTMVKDLFVEGIKQLTEGKRMENFLSTLNTFDDLQDEQPSMDMDIDDVTLNIGFEIVDYVAITADED
ncbi:hypothetical protein BG000_004923 [Podila horticola]|nr:hypothetical protein BG000_004923 [Podila horticola]